MAFTIGKVLAAGVGGIVADGERRAKPVGDETGGGDATGGGDDTTGGGDATCLLYTSPSPRDRG